jgi:Lectin C-type domain
LFDNGCIDGWKYNLNYWTGGTQQGSQGQWSWCGKQTVVSLSNDLKWEPGQPDNKGGSEDCLHLRFVLCNETGAIISDRNCADKYIYACEVLTFYCQIFSIYLIVSFAISNRVSLEKLLNQRA